MHPRRSAVGVLGSEMHRPGFRATFKPEVPVAMLPPERLRDQAAARRPTQEREQLVDRLAPGHDPAAPGTQS